MIIIIVTIFESQIEEKLPIGVRIIDHNLKGHVLDIYLWMTTLLKFTSTENDIENGMMLISY